MQAQVNLAKYPPETAKILHRDIFWFFLHDEEFVSRTINDGNVDLDKFPASKVRQLAKRMESSKATACHIKQVAGDPQAAQINLLRHQCTELPAGKYKKKKSSVKSRQSNFKNHGNENSKCQASTRNSLMSRMPTRTKRGVQSVEIQSMWKAFSALQRSSSVKLVTSLDTLPAFVIRKSKLHLSPGNQRHISYKQGQYMQKKVPYAVNQKITAQVRIPFACRSKCSAQKLISRRFLSQPT